MNFLLAKSCLATSKVKSLTIPRLELQAAVLAVRLKEKIIHQVDFEFNEEHFFSDSQIIEVAFETQNENFQHL